MANKREEARDARRLARLEAILEEDGSARRQHSVRLTGGAWGVVSATAMSVGMSRSAWIEQLILEVDREERAQIEAFLAGRRRA